MYQTLNKIVSSISGSLEFNTSTLSGCMDVIVVRHSEDEFKSSPFHLRFGTMKIFKVSKEKEVKLFVNDKEVEGVRMRLGTQGQAYFLEQAKISRRKKAKRRRASCNIDSIDLSKEDSRIDEKVQQEAMQLGLTRRQDDQEESQDNHSIKSIKTQEGERDMVSKRKRLRSVDRQYSTKDGQKESSSWWIFGKNNMEQSDTYQGSRSVASFQESESKQALIEEQELDQLVNEIMDDNQPQRKSIMTSLFGIFRKDKHKDKLQDDPPSDQENKVEKQENIEIKSPEQVVPEENHDITKEDKEKSIERDIQLSLCGDKPLEQITQEYFEQHRITKEQFMQDHQAILHSTQLIVKLDQQLFPWEVALPQIVSLLVFGQTLTPAPQPAQEPVYEDGSETMTVKSGVDPTEPTYRWIKTQSPCSDTLKKMGLQLGYNKIIFQVQNRLTGLQEIKGAIYLWDHRQKIVISDIDGTITKSDVLGQLYPLVNKDYCHDYITNLLSNIYKNNYRIIYLTARALVQSSQTRDFIDNLHQHQHTLPPGPVIMSPDGLLPSFKREVIYKKPEIFKIAALRDIKSLFSLQAPFYAGLGNRDTDALAYKAVGISLNKIFLVNPLGEVYGINNTYKEDYQALNSMVDSMFPYHRLDSEEQLEKFNSNNYWPSTYKVDIQVEDYL